MEHRDHSADITDNAGGHKRGLRAEPSPELIDLVSRSYGLKVTAPVRDLGGSSNLNLMVVAGEGAFVARVYRPSVSPARLHDIQQARSTLAAHGFPCPVPLHTVDGSRWATASGRLIELETFVANDGQMRTWSRVEQGVHILAQMHDVLKSVPLSSEGQHPRFVNYIDPDKVRSATSSGTDRIRSWSPTDAEERLAAAADELAMLVSTAQERCGYTQLPQQPVHGDFWDNNVLYRNDEIVLIHDFDHMGNRARIDDLALTLYFMASEPTAALDVENEPSQLRRIVDAYDAALENPLSPIERASLPIAIARQPLWSIGGWVAELDDEKAARSHANGMNRAVEKGLSIMRDLESWQHSLA